MDAVPSIAIFNAALMVIFPVLYRSEINKYLFISNEIDKVKLNHIGRKYNNSNLLNKFQYKLDLYAQFCFVGFFINLIILLFSFFNFNFIVFLFICLILMGIYFFPIIRVLKLKKGQSHDR